MAIIFKCDRCGYVNEDEQGSAPARYLHGAPPAGWLSVQAHETPDMAEENFAANPLSMLATLTRGGPAAIEKEAAKLRKQQTGYVGGVSVIFCRACAPTIKHALDGDM